MSIHIGRIVSPSPARGVVSRASTAHDGRIVSPAVVRGTVSRASTSHDGRIVSPAVLRGVLSHTTSHAGRIVVATPSRGTLSHIQVPNSFQILLATARVSAAVARTQSAHAAVRGTAMKTQTATSKIVPLSLLVYVGPVLVWQGTRDVWTPDI